MDYKYPWQEKWDNKRRMPEHLLPHASEQETLFPLNQLPGIDRRTTFSFDSVEIGRDAFAGKIPHDIYLRLTNPTIRALEDAITIAEASHLITGVHKEGLPQRLAEAPVKTHVFACGMGAIANTLLSLLGPGETMITDDVLYGCTDNLINNELKRWGVDVVETDLSRDETAVRQVFEQNPGVKVVYFETPANPNLKLVDIRAVSEIARDYHAAVIVDNTFATPYLQNPLRLGADFVIHSLTKYMNGHGDVLGGSVTGPAEFIDSNDPGGSFYSRRLYGAVMDPHAAVKVMRGAQTLPVRMKRHCDNAEAVVDYLQQHPAVSKVYYPPLINAEIRQKQMMRGGGMVAFEIRGSIDEVSERINRVKQQEVGYIAVSLGLPYTVFEYPAGMTHYFVDPAARKAKGITDNLVRVSVGLEDRRMIIDTFEAILADPK